MRFLAKPKRASSLWSYGLTKSLEWMNEISPILVYDMSWHSRWGWVTNILYTTDDTSSLSTIPFFDCFPDISERKRIKQICLFLTDWLFSHAQSFQSAMQNYIKNNRKQGMWHKFYSKFDGTDIDMSYLRCWLLNLRLKNVFVKREQRKLACSAERRKGRMKSKGLFPDYLEQSM